MTLPIRYYGGKGNLANRIVEYFPLAGTYTTYLEPYGGSGAVLFKKPLCPVEIYNDINDNVYSLYRVIQDEVMFERFHQRAQLAIYHERIAHEARGLLYSEEELSLEDRAFYYWYVNRMFRAGGKGGMSINVVVRRGMSKSTSDFLSSVDGLEEFHQRISRVVVLNRDALDLVEKHARSSNALIYLDPPYVHSARSSNFRYDNDATDKHHQKLVELILDAPAKIILSGYVNNLYAPLDNHLRWRRVQIDHNTTSGLHNEPKTTKESLWVNYDQNDDTVFDVLLNSDE